MEHCSLGYDKMKRHLYVIIGLAVSLVFHLSLFAIPVRFPHTAFIIKQPMPSIINVRFLHILPQHKSRRIKDTTISKRSKHYKLSIKKRKREVTKPEPSAPVNSMKTIQKRQSDIKKLQAKKDSEVFKKSITPKVEDTTEKSPHKGHISSLHESPTTHKAISYTKIDNSTSQKESHIKKIYKGPFGAINGPKFLNRVLPRYPTLARKLGKEGVVVLKLFIDDKGSLKKIQVLHDPGYGFVKSALEALRKSTFMPAVLNGNTISSEAILKIKFKLKDS